MGSVPADPADPAAPNPAMRDPQYRESEYRDGAGLRLTDYPRPSVAVDTAVLTVTPATSTKPAGLGVLLVRRDNGEAGGRAAGWALPGTFLHPGETLADAVRRSLADKTGVTGRHPAQLHVFDAPDRDHRGWVLSVAHLDVIDHAALEAVRDRDRTRIAAVPSRRRLAYDHAAIVTLAVQRLRREYAEAPDPRRLLGDRFTIAELRALHQAVAGQPLGKDTFRRWALPHLRALPATATGRVGRPAAYFTNT